MNHGIPTFTTSTLHCAPMMMLKESASQRRHIQWQKQLLNEEVKCLRCPHCRMITYNLTDIASNFCPQCGVYHHEK